jgi:hypothetical protein
MPIDELLSDLNKVKKWADRTGCYTGKKNKTGLHINVSVPEFEHTTVWTMSNWLCCWAINMCWISLADHQSLMLNQHWAL